MPRRSRRAAPHPSRKLLSAAIGLAGMALLFLAISFAFRGSGNPALLALSRGLREPAWFVLLLAMVVGAVAFALRPRNTNGAAEAEPEWFPNSTEFARSTVMPPQEATPEQQRALLERVDEGGYWRPTCASCGQKMVSRSPRKGGKDFWGCADFPRCRSTLPMRD
jgi:hypothetical protein